MASSRDDLQGITQEADLRVPPGEGAGGPAAAELQPQRDHERSTCPQDAAEKQADQDGKLTEDEDGPDHLGAHQLRVGQL